MSAVEGVTKAGADLFDEEIKSYQKKKESIKGFREKLEIFVRKTSSEKPIVFLIDELDRCRPDYAVDLLRLMLLKTSHNRSTAMERLITALRAKTPLIYRANNSINRGVFDYLRGIFL